MVNTMRTQKTTKLLTNQINITGTTPAEKISEMLSRMLWDITHEKGERLDCMQAKIYGGRTLKSYTTPVAYFDGVNVYELGYYSTTTSKQVSRFAEYHGANVYRFSDLTSFAKDNGIDVEPFI